MRISTQHVLEIDISLDEADQFERRSSLGLPFTVERVHARVVLQSGTEPSPTVRLYGTSYGPIPARVAQVAWPTISILPQSLQATVHSQIQTAGKP